MGKEYKVCLKCIMDTTDPDIQFDEQGVCNHCKHYEELAREQHVTDDNKKQALDSIVKAIQSNGKGKEYDCIIGVSGGVDSTFVAYVVKKLGLRPLAVHLDNGWNTELSVHNIEKILKKLDIDLYTHVLDWTEFKDLQLAFLKSSTVNCEIPTDHALNALLFRVASEKDVKYILKGDNVVTEGILPFGWVYNNRDLRFIKAIHAKFGSSNLTTFPKLGILRYFYYMHIKGIRVVRVLNYIDYNKDGAKEAIEKSLDWEDYGGKHFESIYTRFYQAYILPKKFNIDKRKAHLSTLICSGQMKRDEALREIAEDPCKPEMLREDKEYVLKKFCLTEAEFEEIMSLPIKTYRDYPSSNWFFKVFFSLKRKGRSLMNG